MRRTPSAYLVISAAMLVLAATATARTRPHYGGVLHVQTRESAVDSDQLRSLMAESLTILDQQGRPQPCLADRWESKNGDRRWQFTIHPHISMHDGTPVTGRLIAQILSASQSPVPWRLVQGSDTTVVFDSDSPMPNLPAILASADFAIMRRTPEGALIGTGPFSIQSANRAVALLQANDGYWGGRPYVDSIEISGGRSIRSQWLDLEVGRTDVAEVPGETLRRAQQDHLRTVDSIHGEVVLISISSEVTDANLRHAISASVDRNSLANVVFQKQGQPAASLLPNSLTGYAVLFPQPFDPATARMLRLKLETVPSLTISYDSSDPTMQLTAERIALNARDAGIMLQATPRNSFSKSALQLIRVPLPSTDAAACLAELARDLSAQNLPSVSEMSALYEQERDLLDQARLIPLVHLPAALATSDRVSDPQNLRDYRGLAAVWIEARR